MDIKSILLGFLMKHDMTGYELKKAFSVSFSYFSGISYGSIYPALKKLAKEGLVTMTVQVRDGSPSRKVYRITDDGRQAFLDALKAPVLPERNKSPFLMRLFFFAYLPWQERLPAARRYLHELEQAREALALVDPQIKDQADRYQYLCYQFGMDAYDDFIQRVQKVIDALETESASGKTIEIKRRV